MIRAKNWVRRVRQGDIFKDIDFIEYAVESGEEVEVSKIVFPYVYVLSQDCDLEQDHKMRNNSKSSTQDKTLISVLVAPIYNAEKVYLGDHLSSLELKMEAINKNRTPGKNLRNNTNPRYHYLEFKKGELIPSIIDFKHYFSLNTQYLRSLKKSNYVCSVAELYREDISLRFAHFLSRIGLP